MRRGKKKGGEALPTKQGYISCVKAYFMDFNVGRENMVLFMCLIYLLRTTAKSFHNNCTQESSLLKKSHTDFGLKFNIGSRFWSKGGS